MYSGAPYLTRGWKSSETTPGPLTYTIMRCATFVRKLQIPAAAAVLTMVTPALRVGDLQAQAVAAGDVGPAVTESSANVFAGALEMATVEPSSGVLRSTL